jgi:hypothetical protein
MIRMVHAELLWKWLRGGAFAEDIWDQLIGLK